MKPIDFILGAADNDFNVPAGELQEAIQNNQLRIHSSTDQWEILSYYYDAEARQMVIDIQPYSGTQ